MRLLMLYLMMCVMRMRVMGMLRALYIVTSTLQ